MLENIITMVIMSVLVLGFGILMTIKEKMFLKEFEKISTVEETILNVISELTHLNELTNERIDEINDRLKKQELKNKVESMEKYSDHDNENEECFFKKDYPKKIKKRVHNFERGLER